MVFLLAETLSHRASMSAFGSRGSCPLHEQQQEGGGLDVYAVGVKSHAIHGVDAYSFALFSVNKSLDP